MAVTLTQILEARENRVARQRELLAQYGCPLICFSMNIPGPVKNSSLIQWGFFAGLSRLEAQLRGSGIPVRYRSYSCTDTGCEGYFAVDGDEKTIKALCMEIEQADALGRLFDMDVLDRNGEKTGRPQPRTCLLCSQPAQVCGRSRAHSVEQLQEKVREILSDALNREDRQRISQAAVKSLLFEVAVTPKPGLVDRDNSGSHRDMDIFSFLASASALGPYFERCAAIGQEGGEVFSRLRYPGKLAEAAMYRETGGINTHKGAIFSLGLLCAAAGQQGPEARTPERILCLCGEMTRGLVASELGQRAKTQGERLYRDFGITGIRGQAEQGFPVVKDIGLPVLRRGLSLGLSLNDAAAAALLHMLPMTQDTNLIARSSLQIRQEAGERVSALLEKNPIPTKEQIAELNDFFVERNLSPGGTADLLSLTLFLYFLEKP